MTENSRIDMSEIPKEFLNTMYEMQYTNYSYDRPKRRDTKTIVNIKKNKKKRNASKKSRRKNR